MSESNSSNPFGAPFGTGPTPTLEDFQHWTQVMGRAQQLLMEFALSEAGQQMNQTMLTKWMDPSQWASASAEMLARLQKK